MKNNQELKNLIIEDFLKTNEKYKTEFPNSLMNRNYYEANGHYSGRQYSKIFGGFTKLKKEALKSKNINEDFFRQQKRVLLLQQQNNDLKLEKDKLLKKEITLEHFFDEYKNKIKPIKPIKTYNLKKNNSSNKEAILLLGDWHYGDEIKSEELGGINTFSINILKKRVDFIFKRFVQLCETINLNKIRIYLLGDFLESGIHTEIAENLECNVIDSLLALEEIFIQHITNIIPYFTNIKIVGISGNHSRILKSGNTKPFYKQKQIQNFEYLLYKHIQNSLSFQKNINVVVPRSSFYVDIVNNEKILIMHGDGITRGNGGFGGLPFYGLAMSSAKLFGALEAVNIGEKGFKHLFCGHYHTFGVLNLFHGGKLIINPSLKGTDEFSLYNLRTYSSIEQNMLIINDEGDIESIIRLVPPKEN